MINKGVAPVDVSTTVGIVRVLLGDTDATNIVGGFGEYMYFSDDELGAVLGLYDDSPQYAAARCLETIAASQALLLKSWTSDDLSVRGDAIAESLRKLADQLRKEASTGISSEFYDLFQTVDGDYPEMTWWN